jgi:hypothetical protein
MDTNIRKNTPLLNKIQQNITPAAILLFSQLPVINGQFKPEIMCYQACIANCTNYESLLCNLDFFTGMASFMGTGMGVALCGILTGICLEKCITTCKQLKKSRNLQNEHIRLLAANNISYYNL